MSVFLSIQPERVGIGLLAPQILADASGVDFIDGFIDDVMILMPDEDSYQYPPSSSITKESHGILRTIPKNARSLTRDPKFRTRRLL